MADEIFRLCSRHAEPGLSIKLYVGGLFFRGPDIVLRWKSRLSFGAESWGRRFAGTVRGRETKTDRRLDVRCKGWLRRESAIFATHFPCPERECACSSAELS